VKRAPLWLLLTGLALLPLAARAGSDSNPLLADPNGNPCFEIDQVAAQTTFADPNNPLDHVASCASLCKKDGASCSRLVKRAVSCQMHFASDTAVMKTKVHCDGLKGTDFKDCQTPFLDEKSAALANIQAEQTAELAKCNANATTCAGNCSASP